MADLSALNTVKKCMSDSRSAGLVACAFWYGMSLIIISGVGGPNSRNFSIDGSSCILLK